MARGEQRLEVVALEQRIQRLHRAVRRAGLRLRLREQHAHVVLLALLAIEHPLQEIDRLAGLAGGELLARGGEVVAGRRGQEQRAAEQEGQCVEHVRDSLGFQRF